MEHQLIEYIETELLEGAEKITAEDDLLTSGLLDSMKVMRLIGFVEEQFGITIPPEDMIIDYFLTVDALHTYLAGQQA